MNRRLSKVWLCTLAALAVTICADLFCGHIHLSLRDIFRALFSEADLYTEAIIWKLRLPRIATAIIAGAGLAISGIQMQAVFRNRLADPHILGISAGAGAGVAIVIFLSTYTTALLSSGISVSIAAALGAMIVSAFIMRLSDKVRRTSDLLIIGVLTGFIASALTAIISYQIDDNRLKVYWSWSNGSFTGNTWSAILIMFVALVVSIAIAVRQIKSLNLILFGEDYATAVGSDVRKTRILSMLSCCIVTGAVTAFCGPIGFIGIIAPHIARKLSGQASLRTTLPLSLFIGAVLGIAGDFISQIFPIPVPVGSTIAIIGIPLIFLMMKSVRGE